MQQNLFFLFELFEKNCVCVTHFTLMMMLENCYNSILYSKREIMGENLTNISFYCAQYEHFSSSQYNYCYLIRICNIGICLLMIDS